MPYFTVKSVIDSANNMKTLIDSESQLNLLSAQLSKEQDLKVEPLPELVAEAANRSDIMIYGVTTAEVHISDFYNNKWAMRVPFVVVDLR